MALEFYFKIFLFALITFGCNKHSLIPYAIEQGLQQGSLLLKAKDIETLLKDPHLGPEHKKYLELAKDVLEYAKTNGGLETRANYKSFIAIDRDYVTQIVMAAPKDKFEPYLYDYPIVGRMPYKGFFSDKDAKEFELLMQSKNLDTYRRPVDAFSSLGWFPDPLLSTMFKNPERLIELLFHELTHSTFYFKGEADFNEAFASWVGFQLAIEYIQNKAGFLKSKQFDPEKMLTLIKANHEQQKELALIFQDIQKAGKVFYSQNPLPDREIFFNEVKTRFSASKNPAVQRLSQRPWNNASLQAFGTYYRLIDPIDAYARKKNLSPKEYVMWVMKEGPKSISQIIQF